MSSELRADIRRKPSIYNNELRTLSEAETSKLAEQDLRLVTPFIECKLEEDAKKNWDIFYKRNSTKFFKDRHWTTSEFKELLGDKNILDGLSLLEIGCGVGNLVFPLIEEGTPLRIFACDFSKRAIEHVRSHPMYDPQRIYAFEDDITSINSERYIICKDVDIATMVFVLSAVHPTKHNMAVKNVCSCLKNGGRVLIRDYAVNDMTQIRFKPGSKIDDNFYKRQDGTRTFYFSIEYLKKLFQSAGFQEEFCYYVHSRTINKKEAIDAPRTFIQAKFLKL